MLKTFMSVAYQVKEFLEDDSRKAETSQLDFNGVAQVSQTIVGPHQPGRVYFRGTWWPARCQDFVTLRPGETVQVIDMNNITLFVEPAPCSSF